MKMVNIFAMIFLFVFLASLLRIEQVKALPSFQWIKCQPNGVYENQFVIGNVSIVDSQPIVSVIWYQDNNPKFTDYPNALSYQKTKPFQAPDLPWHQSFGWTIIKVVATDAIGSVATLYVETFYNSWGWIGGGGGRMPLCC